MFRFTIRELILLTVIVAMGAAWWVDHSKLAEENGRFFRAFVSASESSMDMQRGSDAKSALISDLTSRLDRLTKHHPTTEPNP